MNKIFNLFLALILISNCSLNKNSKFWTKSEKIVSEKTEDYKEVFPTEEALKKEFNSNLKIKLTSKINKNTSINNYLNNNGRVDIDGSLKKSSRYKFSKIDNFNQYQPELSF